MSNLLASNWGLRAGLAGAVLVVAACSAGGDSERASSTVEALTIGVPYRVRAIDFTAFNDSDTVHEGTCGSGPVDQQTVSDNGVTCGVAYTKPGEWLEYSLQVATAGKFSLVSRVAGNATGKTIRLLIDGVAVGGSQTVPSGGWTSFADRTVNDVTMSAGTHTLRVLFETGDTNFNYVDVTPGTATLPQRIEAENYQRAFESTPTSNSGNSCNRGDGVDTASTSDMTGGCLVGWATANEWLEYDVTVPTAGLYDFTARLASATVGRQLQLSVDGAPVGTVTSPNTGYNAFEDRKIQNVSLSAGAHVVRATFVQGDLNLNYIDVSVHPVIPGYSFGGSVNYNIFVFQDLSTAPSVGGPVAAGRDIIAQSFAYNTTALTTIGGLAGRNFNGTNGSVQRDLVYGNTASLNSVTIGSQGVSRKATPLDFAAEKSTLDLTVANLASLAANGTTTISSNGGIFTFTGTDPSRNVFSVNGAALSAGDQFNFTVPATSTAIVNVTGTTAAFDTASLQLGSLTPGHLLWNFPQATTLRVTSVGVKGTLLAVNAAVTMSSASLDGALLAGSLSGTNTGITWVPFDGSIAVCGGAALSITPGSPQLVNTPLSLSASATCADGKVAEFHYDYLNSGTETTWHEVASGFGTTAVNWNTSGLPAGTYQVRAQVRRVGEAAVSGVSATSSFILDNPVLIPITAATVETFNGLGTTDVSLEPSGWRIDKLTNPRTVGNFAAAIFKTDFRAGALLPASSSNGIYNFGSGVANAQATNYWLNSTDRAPGWFSAGSALGIGGTKSGNLYVALIAPSDKDITSLKIGYDIEKYSMGTNPAGFRVQLYSSPGGTTWTNAGSDFLNSFPPDANNLGFDPVPGQTVNVPPKKLTANIPRNTRFFLAWNYTVDSTTSPDGSNAQAIAIDNVSIQGSDVCVPDCTGKKCGDELSDGCGGRCDPVCGPGDIGCTGDEQCKVGLGCNGHETDNAVATVCVSQTCLLSPQLLGCGYPGAPCGPSCTIHPRCSSDADCPTGLECPIGNGYRYGAPDANVCEPPLCKTNPHYVGCGSISDACGLCECTPQCENKHCGDVDLSDGCGGVCPGTCGGGLGKPPLPGCTSDFDCDPESFCALGQGPRVGLPVGSNACLLRGCNMPAPADCGTVTSRCGLCPAPAASCVGRECGSDPVSGESCGGDCADDQFCSATGKCVGVGSTPPIIVTDSTGPHPIVLPTAPPAAGLGAIPGSFTVTEQGSASYSIPIELPPGRHGVAPSLQISYTSSTGNGTLGVGWSLDGLSTISRCNKTYSQEGQARPPQLAWTDAFCLDGQRLIEIAPGEFRTQVETFARIRRVQFPATHPIGDHDGDPFNNPPPASAPQNDSFFEVMTKDGRKLLYGSEAQAWGNQRTTSAGAFVRTWALNRVEDRNGNSIHIVYRQGTSRELDPHVSATELVTSTTELVPDSISYTGNGSVDGDRQIKFEYSDNRPDKISGYQFGGGALVRTLRLEHIKVLALDALVRRYDLHYEAAPNKESRLTSIQECDGPSSICKGATTFSYKTEQGFDAGESFTPAGPDPKWGAPSAFTPYGFVLSRGAYDVLVTRSDAGTSSINTALPGLDAATLPITLQLGPGAPVAAIAIAMINLFTSSEENKDWFVDITNDFVKHSANVVGGTEDQINDGICPQTVPSVPQVIRNQDGTERLYDTCDGQPKTFFVDVDGDGVQDRLQCSQDGQQIEYYLARNHGHLIPAHVKTLPGPDGSFAAYTNFCASERAWGASPKSAPEPPFITATDVDGDGTSNILVNDRTGFSGLFFDGPTPEWRRLSTDPVPIHLANYYVALLDANGDGLRDVLALPIPGSHEYPHPFLWTNTGTGFNVAIVTGLEDDIWAPGVMAYVMDYDGDGIEELLQPWSVPKPNCDPNAQKCTAGHGGNCTRTPAAIACQGAQQAWSDEAKLPHNWSMRRFVRGNVTWEEISGPSYPGALGDFDGDGNPDLVTRKPDQTGSYFMHHGSGRLQNVLETVIDGLGRRVDVHYDLKNPEGKPTYNDPHFDHNFAMCTWPNICSNRPEQPLVSSFEQKHSEVPDVWQTDVDTRLSYGLLVSDASGLGTLGFNARHTTVRDGAGVLRGESEIGYLVPPSSREVVDTGKPAIEAPYSRALVGIPSYIETTGVHAASDMVDSDDDRLVTRTDYHWAEQTSTSGGRPFAALQFTDTSVSTWAPKSLIVAKPLTHTIAVSQIDGFGNTTFQSVATEDLDSSFPAGTTPLPGSSSVLQVQRDFSPSAADVDQWLISKARYEEVSDQPRCYGGVLTCATEKRTRHVDYEYYDSGEIKTTTRAANESAATQITTYGRDAYGNVSELTQQDASGNTRTISIGFDTRGMYPMSYTDGLGRTTDVRFDERFGKVNVVSDPNEITETWAYDDFGILRDHQGPSGHETIDYDLDQRIVDGLSAKYVVARQVEGGAGTTERFNSLGQIVTRESSGLKGATVVESFKYDDRNLLHIQYRPHLPGDTSQGAIIRYYDRQDRPLMEIHPDGVVLTHEHAVAALLKPEFATLAPTSTRAVSVVRSRDASQNITYAFMDRDGRTVEVVDANKRATNYTYGAFGSVRRIIGPNGTLGYEYDNYGRVLSSFDAAVGGTTSATYNGLDEIVSALDPANRPTNIYYDDLGRTKRVENSDGVTTYTYDVGVNALGRLTQSVGPTGQQTDYAYEAKNAARNRGLLSTVTKTLLAPGATSSTTPTQLTTAFHFDEFSRLQQIDYPGASGFAVEYGFDSAGNVISAGDPADSTKVYWQVSGIDQGYRINQETLGNRVITDRHYDPSSGYLDRITTQRGNSSIQDLTYGYTKDNLTSRANAISGLSETFGYDALNRVNSTTYSDRPGAESIKYDPVSNAISHKDPVGDYSYQPQGRDWVKAAGDTEYSQDPFGNVNTRSGPNVPGGLQEYVYTTFNLPSHVTLQSGAIQNVDFGYDAEGARVVKRTDAETTYYAGDLYQQTTSASGTAQRFMVYAGSRAVAAVTQASSAAPLVVSYLHDDALGSVESITAADGTLVGGRHFDTFGDARGPIASVAQEPYGYTGQEQDPELGLVNMHGRMYDPRLGQFLSPDPEIQSPYGQGLNRFAYVFNSPMNFVDPSGFTATESYWEAGLGLGVPFTAGLIATVATSGVSEGAAAGAGAVQGAFATELASASATATDAVGAVGEAVSIGSALTSLVLAAGNQPVHQIKTPPAPTRATKGRNVARTNHQNSPISARSERPAVPTPAEPKVAGQNKGGPSDLRLAFEPGAFCKANPRTCMLGEEVASDAGRVVKAASGPLIVLQILLTPSTLSDLPAPPPPLLLYHYTTIAKLPEILASEELLPSLGEKNARYGAGVYLTDLSPDLVRSGQMTIGQLARALFGVPWRGAQNKVAAYLQLNATGLPAASVAPHIFLIPSSTPVSIAGRVVDAGITQP